MKKNFNRIVLCGVLFFAFSGAEASFKKQVAYGGTQGIHTLDDNKNEMNKNLLKAQQNHKDYEKVSLTAIAEMLKDVMKDETDSSETAVYKESVGQIIAYLKAARDDIGDVENIFAKYDFKISMKNKAGFSVSDCGKQRYSHHGLDLYNMLQLVTCIYSKLDKGQRKTFRELTFGLIKDNISLRGGCYPGHYNRLTQLINIFM